jgi:hypothetical protein
MTPREPELRRVEASYQKRHPGRALAEERELPLALAALTQRMREWEQAAHDWNALPERPAEWVLRGLQLCWTLPRRPWFRRLRDLERAGLLRVLYAPLLPWFEDGDAPAANAYACFVGTHLLDESLSLTRRAFALAGVRGHEMHDRVDALRAAIGQRDATDIEVLRFAEFWRDMVGTGLARTQGHPPDEPRLAFLDGVHLKCIASGYERPTHRDIRELALWSGVERMSVDACRVWVREHALWSDATWQQLSSWRASQAVAT